MGEKERISGHTHLISLIGSPVEHSGSPATHNLSFEKLGIDSAYLVFDVKEDGVETALAAMRTLEGWDGSNVTMPCKRAVIPFLDELDPAAELMGAVNVIEKKDGKLTMTLVGIGGAGSAVLTQAALDGVKTIHAFARANFDGTYERVAEGLVPAVNAKTECDVQLHDLADMELLKKCIEESDILVNATNVGMGEGCEDSLIPVDYLRPDLAVADVIYFPRETRLIRDAKALGCVTVPGIGMMLEQAAAGEKIWYDAEMPTDEIAEALFSE